MRFSLFSMFNQVKIINYFKFVDQSFKSFKLSAFINCFCSTSRIFFSVNRIAEISQYQHIAIDETSSLKIQQKFKFDVFINNFNSTSRVCFSVNQDAKTSHIAFETNFTSLIKSTKTSSLKTQQKIKIRVSIDSSKSRYFVVADVDHINKNIRVETSLTNAKKYNSIKSSIKSTEKFKSIKFSIFINCFNSTSRICFSVNQDKIKSLKSFKSIKLFKSLKSFKKLKFSIFSSRLNSTSRVCFSVNQIAETSQYQHIAIDKVKLFKSLKSIVIINSLNSTLRFSLSVNHDSIISQMLISMFSRIDFLRVLINQQMIYVSILASSSFRTKVHRCRRRSHRDLNIRVETTLKKKKE